MTKTGMQGIGLFNLVTSGKKTKLWGETSPDRCIPWQFPGCEHTK